jgi:DNA repair photolyase
MNLENVAPKIEYIKSSLSINTSIGCYLGCEYCVVGEILTKKVPKRVSTPRETVDSLLKNNLFVPDETLLAINNKTDPFLGYVKEDTFEIMELLKERGLKNPLMIISRLPLTKRDLSYLEEFEAPTFFVTSYSHLSYPVEKS